MAAGGARSSQAPSASWPRVTRAWLSKASRCTAGALLLACALGLWALPAVHRLAVESQALVTLGQLALGAWLLRAPRRRPAVAVA